jgi:FMN phosphatase YigB (HAD superfamily)
LEPIAISSERLKAVLFDWGNTLVDYPLADEGSQIAFIDAFLLRYCGSHGAPPSSPGDWGLALKKLNEERSDHGVVPFASRVPYALPFLHGFDTQALENALCEEVFARAVCFEDSLPAIESLLECGFVVGIVTNLPWGLAPALWASEFVRHLGDLSKRLPIVCCGDTGFRKPHRAPFLRCLEMLGQRPRNALMVGDSIASDIQGARGVGIQAIRVRGEHSVGGTDALHFATVGILTNSLLDSQRR